MSENLDLVRSIYADWERGEFGRATEWAHPEIEFVVADGPEPGSWLGVAGVAQGARAILSPFEEARVQAVEYRELDGRRILVLVNSSGRAKKSGVALEQHAKAADLFHVRDNKVTKLVAYWTASVHSPTSASRSRRCRRRTWSWRGCLLSGGRQAAQLPPRHTRARAHAAL